MQATHSIHFDIGRIIACWMVILLHSSAFYFFQFNEGWMFANLYDSFVRPSVPIFLMISGALFLTRQEPVSVFYQKRLVRIFPPLIFWSCFYLAVKDINISLYQVIFEWPIKIFTGPVVYHFWYLYAIVGSYLFAPFMAKIYQGCSESERRLYLMLWFFLGCVSPSLLGALNSKFNLIQAYDLSAFMGIMWYLFLGAYLTDKAKKNPPSIYLNGLLFLSSGLATTAATYWISHKFGAPNEHFYAYLAPFVVLSALSLFNLFYLLAPRIQHHAAIIKSLSDTTLGIYCIHIFWLEYAQNFVIHVVSTPATWWIIPVTATGVFLLSFITIAFLRQLKWFRWVT